MMKALIKNWKVIEVVEEQFPVHRDLAWVDCPADCEIGFLYDNGIFTPPVIPEASIILDVLSTDVWVIPADSTTIATVTYTDTTTVYFSVNETTHAVEPIDNIATLEITAAAPGPIRVEVKANQLIITAIEVQI